MVVQSPNLIQFAGHGMAVFTCADRLEDMPALLNRVCSSDRIYVWPAAATMAKSPLFLPKVLAIWVERPLSEAAHLLTLAMALSHAEQVFGTHAV